MKMTRRELAIAAAGASIVGQIESDAQTAPADNLLNAARAANSRNSSVFSKFEIPIATEPAFQFKA